MLNYVIATYNGKCNRMHKYPSPNDVLRCHLKKIYSYNHSISQITIMKPTSENYYEGYYDLDDIIDLFDIPVEIVECENFGYSGGQFLKAYEIYKDKFDYYIFLEDDYCPGMNNFDTIITDCYKKIKDGIGLLCSLVQGNKWGLPIHFEGSIFTNIKTLQLLYDKTDENPRMLMDKFTNSSDATFSWDNFRNDYIGGYYQMTFSRLFTLAGIRHEGYMEYFKNNRRLQFPYWHDGDGGKIILFTPDDKKKSYILQDIYNSPFIAIQVCCPKFINMNTHLKVPKQKIVFITGMNRTGSSLLTQCLVKNGFSTGNSSCKNTEGYFENIMFTRLHDKLLIYNDMGEMKYNEAFLEEYRKLIKDEFTGEKLIVIQDLRLSFFILFIQDVCKDIYDFSIIFLTQDDKNKKSYSESCLKIDHRDIIYKNTKTMNKISFFCDFNIIYDTEKYIHEIVRETA